MKMHNPPHPGEVLSGLWLEPLGISLPEAAAALGISEKVLADIVSGNRGISPEIAVRLSLALGSSAESWMGHQVTYDLWQVEQHRDQLKVKSLKVA